MLTFYKYQGAGNDFVMIDHRSGQLSGLTEAERTQKIAHWCDRHFGVGADGLILLEEEPGYDFGMRYYNADGRESSMCGNGGRCIVAFASQLGLVSEHCRFLAIDGPHEAYLKPDSGWVELQMKDVSTIEHLAEGVYSLHTGSPHYVAFVPEASAVAVVTEGRRIRYSPAFQEHGINVNFVSPLAAGGLLVATYERGVEDETLACGTGVTAAALAWANQNKLSGSCRIPITAKGGQLEVRFLAESGVFSQIWLCGSAQLVFEGSLRI